MRPSNKTLILQAAIRVIEAEGITAVTFDSVAAEAGLTRGGIIYHFPSRENLIGAIHASMAQQWEHELAQQCGKAASDATATERLVAYIRTCANSASPADLQMLLDSPNGEHDRVWSDVIERWTPQGADDGVDEVRDAQWIALMAADGLWLNEAVSKKRLPDAKRRQIAERIVALLTEPAATGADDDPN